MWTKIIFVPTSLENPKTGQSTKIDLLARQLDDGTWEIYDIPNITNIRDISIDAN